MEQSFKDFLNGKTSSDYLKVSRRFWEEIEKEGKGGSFNDSDSANTFRDEYFKGNYLNEIFTLFKKLYEKNYAFTFNTSVWSFLANKRFPTNQSHLNVGENDLKLRNEGFDELRASIKKYSTLSDIIGNNITNSYYFDPVIDKVGRMNIYEVDLVNKRVLANVAINGTHRAKLEPLKRFGFHSIKRYIDARSNEGIEELNYQNQVIRWYIRTGLFNPTHTSLSSDDEKKNLLTFEEGKDIKPLLKTLEQQCASYNPLKTSLSIEEKKKKEDRNFNDEDDKALDELIEYIFSKNQEEIAARIWTFDKGFFDLSQHNNSITDIYWVPLLTGKKDRPTGGVQYINVNKPLHKKGDLNDLLDVSAIMTRHFSGLFDDSQMQEIDYENEKTIATAASVAIMSRNISHNIGSHTMSYEKNDLSNEKAMFANGVLDGLIAKDREDDKYYFNSGLVKPVESPSGEEKYLFNIYEEGKDIPEFSYLRAKGHFDGYLQERIDYVGAIASGSRFYYGNVHFLDDIVLNFLRKPRTTKSVVGRPLTAVRRNVLLERIVKSEEYDKEDIEITYFEEDCSGVQISLPTGVTGRQGIYAMLENIIRNTAKHGATKKQRKGKIKIHLVLKPRNDDYYQLSIIDNSGIVEKDKIVRIQNSINEALMKDGKIDESKKGIKEIQIAAAWLRGVDPRDIDEYQRGEQPILEVSPFEGEGANTRENSDFCGLQFDILVKKSKTVLLIDELGEKNVPETWSSKAQKSLQIDSEHIPFAFVAIDKNMSGAEEYLERNKSKFPVRTLLYDFSKINFDELGEEKVREEAELKIYEEWLANSEFGNESIEVAKMQIAVVDEFERETKTDTISSFDDEGDALDSKKSYNIILRYHNDGQKQFEDFKKSYPDLFNEATFVEGITGNNSTARLCRMDELDELWARKVQESAVCKVAIFDERIWKETTLQDSQSEKGFNADVDYEDEKFRKKNIYIYTITFSEENTAELRNLRNEVEAYINNDGEINWTTDKQEFHFISFHQGMLDKIFNHFNVSNKEDRKVFFEKMKATTDVKLRYYFHSGRSYTPEMPGETGFIPLSSLDAAFRDCKYRLTELLFSGFINNK